MKRELNSIEQAFKKYPRIRATINAALRQEVKLIEHIVFLNDGGGVRQHKFVFIDPKTNRKKIETIEYLVDLLKTKQ